MQDEVEKSHRSVQRMREGWKDCKMGKKREACRFGAHVMNACWDNRCVVMSFSVCVCVYECMGRSNSKVHSILCSVVYIRSRSC